MSRTVMVTLGDDKYEIPRLTMGQLEELTEFWEKADKNGNWIDDGGKPLSGKPLLTHMLNVAAIVFRRSVPKIENVRDLECRLSDIQIAVSAVTSLGNANQDTLGNAAAGASPAL